MAEQPPPHPVDRSLARHGGLTYLEISTTDPSRAAEFYAQVVGWTTAPGDSREVKFSDPAGQLIGRFIAVDSVPFTSGLLPYIYVDRIERAIARVEFHGGRVITSPYREGNLWVARVRDPDGNVIGLWQAADA